MLRTSGSLPDKQQAGFSILELMVAMVIISIISGMIAIFFSSSINDFIKIQVTNNVTTDRSRAMNRMIQVLRGVTKIENAGSNNLTVYTFFSPTDETPSKVTYSYLAGEKRIEVSSILASGTAPDYTYTSTPKVNTILTNIELTKPLFSYVDKTGGTGPFDAASLSNITMIEVMLAGKSYNTQPIDLSTTVLLRNRTGVQ